MQVRERKIMIVDDNQINRRILTNILSDKYELVDLEDGQKALEEVRRNGSEYSLILLDLRMPVMDGYSFMETLKKERLQHPPIIVMTGSRSDEDELRSLDSGASDFIPKPFNAEIVRYRIDSIIRLRETSSMINQLKHDQLTGAYTKEYFYQYVQEILERHPNEQYDIVCCDVESFKLVNERYGTKLGDELLCTLVQLPFSFDSVSGICGRLAANTFGMLCYHKAQYNNQLFDEASRHVLADFPVKNVVLKYGVYHIDDVSMGISGMCDRAVLAIQNIKHIYGTSFAVYDDQLRVKLLHEQQIVDSMERGIQQDEFQIYLQPKHDANSSEIVGAEALVRWNHPTFGFMAPGTFIPLFEKNGFITQLDAFVWEETCRQLCEWKEQGKELIPVSMNVSRADFDAIDLAEHFQQLSDRYELAPAYIHLEVTETAYVDNPKHIIETVEKLREKGFKIEMDDFGTGYSSLNMLGELPVDYIKLDAKFMREHKNKESSRNVLTFVLRLAHWLGLPTIAEGVETEEELEMLRSMGCLYVQGYFFAKPMPVDEFEEYWKRYELSKERRKRLEEAANQEHRYFQETVLIVEDVEATRSTLEQMLKNSYNLLFAKNGKEALQILRERRVSVMLLDLFMPEMDGFQVIQQVKQDIEICETPMIVVSEAGMESEIKALQEGADWFVPKPIEPELLRQYVNRAIDLVKLRLKCDSYEAEKQQLTDQAFRDNLTGLYNRRGINHHVEHLAENRTHGIILLDVDDLKGYNDKMGHPNGDELLRHVAEIIRKNIRSGDFAGRIGGDEFMVVLQNVGTIDIVEKKAKFLQGKIDSYQKKDPHSLGCSVGGALFLGATDLDRGYAKADRALYEDKRDRKVLVNQG